MRELSQMNSYDFFKEKLHMQLLRKRDKTDKLMNSSFHEDSLRHTKT